MRSAGQIWTIMMLVLSNIVYRPASGNLSKAGLASTLQDIAGACSQFDSHSCVSCDTLTYGKYFLYLELNIHSRDSYEVTISNHVFGLCPSR
ncbi:hypothetical protein A0H81_13159 [Grifola frondosa]|uniref:Gnk2-homologous domain-containing protein n=1 Tax=Grifola frondosa TaxID=5627 RepID=A0A1C7LV45_GRIFR|nr:hypothetical protein A0H81_13159 [Grifola frondosa]